MNLPSKERIRLFITGGTIDSEKIDGRGGYHFGKTHLRAMLAQARNRVQMRYEVLMLKDSTYMIDFERRYIRDKCRSCPEKRILITHGTDSMVDTAVVLALGGVGNKTIVLTGSIVPYNQPKSDAMFNLGAAMTAVQLLPAGTYIAMNGKIFNWDNVKKNRKLGILQERK